MQFFNTYTETIVDAPAHYAGLKPNLIPLDEYEGELGDPCVDCHCEVEEDDPELADVDVSAKSDEMEDVLNYDHDDSDPRSE